MVTRHWLKRLSLAAMLALAVVPSSGCKLFFYAVKDMFILGNFFWTTPFIPVSPYFSQQIEDTMWNEERYKRVPVLDPIEGDHWAGLAIDDSGSRLYTGLRGSNRIAVVDAATLSPIAAISCGGDWPRNLWLAGEMLYVANERSSTVTSFRVDPVTGIPSPVGSPEAVPTPTYLLPAS